MGLFTNTCNHCGHPNSKAAKHCNHCGKPTTEAWTWCRNCGAEVAADSSRCHACSTQLQDQPERLLSGDRLKLPPNWLAVRLALRVPQRTLNHGLQVDNGTQALLKVNGEPRELLQPKYHLFDSFLDRLLPNKGQSDNIEATLFSTGLKHPTFDTLACRDCHGLAITMQCRVSVSIADASTFDGQAMQGLDVMTEAELAKLIGPFVAQALSDEMRDRDALLMDRDNAPRRAAQQSLADRLAISLSGFGLATSSVAIISISGASMNDLQRQRSENAHRGESQRLEQDAAVQKAEHQRLLAQTQHDFSEQLKALSHDAKLSEQERALYFELQTIQGGDKLGEAKSKARIAELIRRVEEIRHKTAEAIAQTSGAEDVIDLQLLRKLGRDKMKVQGALHLAQMAMQSAQNTSVPQANDVAKVQRLDNLSGLLHAIESGDMARIATMLGQWNAGVASATPPSAPPPHPRTPTLADGMRPYRRSVGMIVAVSPSGRVTPLGTAWAWKRSRSLLAATNAHVCDAAQQWLSAGDQIEWRLSGTELPGIVIDSWKQHPIYRKAGSVVCGGGEGTFPSHDVALLKLKTAPPSEVAPLSVASPAEIRSLSEGAALASWSCATEGIVGTHLDAPQAQYHQGQIVALSDYHFKPVRPGGEANLIHHSLPTVGGSSGSPVFALMGGKAKVIAMNCAGNALANMAQFNPQAVRQRDAFTTTRVPSSAQQNFAMPCSLLNGVPEP